MDQIISANLTSGDPFDGLICSNDLIAIAAISAIHKAVLVVPDNVSVVGFDDIGIAELNSPPLTTVKQNIKLGAEH